MYPVKNKLHQVCSQGFLWPPLLWLNSRKAKGACALRVKHIFTSLVSPVCLRMRQVHAVLDQRVVGTLRLHALPHGAQHSIETAVEGGEMRPR